MLYDDDDDEDLLIAERLFNDVTDENDVQMQAVAEKKAVEITTKLLSGVAYTTYEMPDRSKITFGDNGFVGCSTE